MSERPKQDPQKTETDPRFPSGEWKGFWMQRPYYGKQHMELSLTFIEGRVTGSGRDIVGKFVFDGTYELASGKCEMIKTYLGKHKVQYAGVNEGDGMWLWGVWHLRHMSDGFHLWPAGVDDPTQPRDKASADQPVVRVIEDDPIGAEESDNPLDVPVHSTPVKQDAD